MSKRAVLLFTGLKGFRAQWKSMRMEEDKRKFFEVNWGQQLPYHTPGQKKQSNNTGQKLLMVFVR